jgi:hypothetical protein
MGPLQLKLSMLALWIAGIVAYFYAVSNLTNRPASFWITLILVLTPAWADASMKAWSGYITSFAATAALFHLLTRDRQRQGRAFWLLCGALTGIIYLAQPVWLPGVLPILLFVLWAHRTASFALLYATGASAVILGIRTLAAGRVSEYWTRPAIGNSDLAGSIPAVFHQLYVNLTGHYYLAIAIDPGPITAFVAAVWCALLLALTLLQIYRLVSRQYLLWSHLLCTSVVSTLLANWLLLDARDPRYLLPISALLVTWAGIEATDFTKRTRVGRPLRLAAVGFVIALGALSMIEFRNFSINPAAAGSLSERQRMDVLVSHLHANGVRHVFSLHPLLQWQLAFYSREEIVARWTSDADRYPPYISAVDRALHAGKAIAVIGYAGATKGLEGLVPVPEEIVVIDNRYVAYVGPDKGLLQRMQFRFRGDGVR